MGRKIIAFALNILLRIKRYNDAEIKRLLSMYKNY